MTKEILKTKEYFQFESILLKDKVSEIDVSIYREYIGRLNKENEMYWNRFKIYFGFNSGVFVVLGYLLKPFLENADYSLPDNLKWICVILTTIGFLLSSSWLLLSIDGAKWQSLMTISLQAIEDKIFKKPKYGLYNKIAKSITRIDIIKMNIYTIVLFMVIWLVLGLLIVFM